MIHILHHTSTCLSLACWPGVLVDISYCVFYESSPLRITEVRFRTIDVCRLDGEVLLSASVAGEDYADSVVLREIASQLERDLELRELMEQHANREART